MKEQRPGDLIKAAMKSVKVSQITFARFIPMAPTQVSEVLSGKRPLTPDFCLALEEAGVGDAEIWLFIYCRYQLRIARESKRK